MSFSDRDYNRGGSDSFGAGAGFGPTGRRILNALNATFPIGTYLGIRVRVHITFVLLPILYLITSTNVMFTAMWVTALFLCVLLHEFGHCLGCRAVGGRADDILMWPLGGLAFCHSPRRPFAEFVTVACGPLVNVVLALLIGGGLVAAYGFGPSLPISLDPFQPLAFWPASPLGQLAVSFFIVNYILLLFNLALVFYPFDGGRLVQIGLWKIMGYERSMSIAATVGMVGAVAVALFGLAMRSFLLILIGAFGFYVCYQQKKMLRQTGGYGVNFYGGAGGEAQYESESWRGEEQPTGWLEQRRLERAEKKQQAIEDKERARLAEIDRILDKVHRDGLASLSSKEKRILQDDTQRKQQS